MVYSDKIHILFIDDPFSVNTSLWEYLQHAFKEVTPVFNEHIGLEKALSGLYDVVMLDFDIPNVNGLELASRIKALKSEQIVLMVSSTYEHQTILKALHIGIDGFITKPFIQEPTELLFKNVCEKVLLRHEAKHYQDTLEQRVQERTQALEALQALHIESYKQTLFALVNLIEERDAYTGGHSMRVATYASKIAKNMGLSDDDIQIVYEAAMLHDIGKIVIPDVILLKPDKLSSAEYALIQHHVYLGLDILQAFPIFEKFIPIIEAHHERYDGSGYPKGLKNDAIPLASHIIAVADSFDAMTTRRIYKNKHSQEGAIKELLSLKSKYYHPLVVDAAIDVFQACTIDQKINQYPNNALEHERFAFFFKDQLTHLFNDHYWAFLQEHITLNATYTYKSAFTLRRFKAYNERYGFEAGNDCLKYIAAHLKQDYPTCTAFRLEGDTFVLLSHIPIDFSLTFFSDVPMQGLDYDIIYNNHVLAT